MGVPKNSKDYEIHLWKLSHSHIGQKVWNEGIPMREETKIKLSNAKKGMGVGEKNGFFGKNHSKEVRKLLSANAKWHGKYNPNHGMKGKKHSDESKKIFSEKFKGRIPWNKDVKNCFPQEVRERRSETRKRRFKTGEIKLNRGNFVKGRNPFNKGKTFIELYGEEKSNELIKKMNSIEKTKKLREYVGEKCSQWKGGKSFEPYTTDFSKKIRREIKNRDGKCMLCNTNLLVLKELKRQIHIHHIDYNKLNSFPQNLVTLCHNCHMITNSNRENWVIFFQKLFKEEYKYEYGEDQKIVLDFLGEK